MSLALKNDPSDYSVLCVLSGADSEELVESLEEWDIDIVFGAAEALESLQEYDYSVILSGVEDEGEGLLSTVKQRYPAIARVLIADVGQVAKELSGLQAAHQMIARPLDPATLEMVLDRATGGIGQVAPSRMELTIGETTRLPTLSTSFVQLLKVLDDPDVDAQMITRVMRSDPAMVAKTLQMANSSFFRLPRKVNSLQQAVVYLGINALRAATLAGRCFEELPNLQPRYLEQVRKKSLFATQMVRQMAGAQAQDALTASILQDIGQLLLLGQVDDYSDLLDEAERGELHLHDLERKHLGITHAQVGAALLALWGLPESVVRAVAFSHTRFPLPARGMDCVALTYIAGALTIESDVERACPDLMPDSWLECMGLQDDIKIWRDYTDELSMLWPGA